MRTLCIAVPFFSHDPLNRSDWPASDHARIVVRAGSQGCHHVGGDGHSLATNAEPLKSTQALTRQSTERITMDIYSHVLADERTEASRRICPKSKRCPKFSTL